MFNTSEYGTCVVNTWTSAESKQAQASLVSFVGLSYRAVEMKSPQHQDVVPGAVGIAPCGVPHAQRAVVRRRLIKPLGGTIEPHAQASNEDEATEEDASSYDPAVLAALPDDIRAEMLEAERR